MIRLLAHFEKREVQRLFDMLRAPLTCRFLFQLKPTSSPSCSYLAGIATVDAYRSRDPMFLPRAATRRINNMSARRGPNEICF